MADYTFTVRVDTAELHTVLDELSDRITLVQEMQHQNYAWTHPLTWRDFLDGVSRLWHVLPRNEKIRVLVVYTSIGLVATLLFDLMKWMVR